MKDIGEFIKNTTRDDDYSLLWGVDRVMKSLRPNIGPHALQFIGGEFNLIHYEGDDPPTNQEIRDEYYKQIGVAEFYEYMMREHAEEFKAIVSKIKNTGA